MRTAFSTAKRSMGLFALAAVMAMLAAACGGEDPTATPRPADPVQPAAPTATPTAETMVQPDPTATPTPLPPGVTPPPPTATPTPAPVPTATPLPPEERVDFGGKTVQIVVGYLPGGGFDTFSRIFAAHLSDALEGNPNVIVSNKPGANTLVAVKSVIDEPYRDRRPAIVVVNAALIQSEIVGGAGEFNPASDLVYLGAPDFTPSEHTFCIRTSVADSLDDYLAGNYSIGLIGQIDGYAQATEWAVQAGFPFNRLFGHQGTSGLNAAFNSGDIDITPTCRDSEALRNPEWAEGYATPLFYTIVEPQWVKDGKAEGKWEWVTSMRDIAEERFGASAGHLDAFDKLMELSASSRIFAMSADTPPDVVASVREAFERVVSSDAFIADMKSRNYDVGLRTGNQYQAMVEGIANLPPETFEIIKGLFPD